MSIKNRINKVFSGGGLLGQASMWFAKDVFNSMVDYSEEIAAQKAKDRQPKSKIETINSNSLDIFLNPNTFSEILSIPDNLTLFLNKPTDGTIPTYNASFILGNASELDFNVESDLGYNIFWAHKDPIKPYNEYAMYVTGNIAWLYSRPVTMFEGIYDITSVNSSTTLLGTDSKSSNIQGFSKKVIADGVNVGNVNSHAFTSKGDKKVYFIFDEMPPMNSCFNDITNLKSVNFCTIGNIYNVDINSAFYDNEVLNSVNITTDSIWHINNSSNMFYNCKNLTSEGLNQFLRKTTNSSKDTIVYSMFYNCRLLDYIDLSNWDCNAIGILGNSTYYPSQIVFKNNSCPLLCGSSYTEEGSDYPEFSEESPGTRIVNLDKGCLPYKNLTFYSEDNIIASYTLEEALSLTELPAEPEHADYLTFNGWGITLEELKEKLQSYHYYNVIARYTNNRDYHFFDVSLASDSVTVNFDNTVSGVEIDWGDGSEIEVVNNYYISHTYPYKFGRWDIKIYPKGNVLDDISINSDQSSYPDSTDFIIHDKARFYGRGYYSTGIGLSAYRTNDVVFKMTFPNGKSLIAKDQKFTEEFWGYCKKCSYYSSEEQEEFNINATLTNSYEVPNLHYFKINRVEYINGVKKVRYASPFLPQDATSVYIPFYGEYESSTYGYITYNYHDTHVSTMVIPESVQSVTIKSLFLEALILPEGITCDITGCPNLTFIDNYNNSNITLGNTMYNLRFAWFPTTNNELSIEGFRRLKYFSVNTSSINKLTIKDCFTLPEIPQIDSVKDISITGCPSLKSFDLLPTYTSCAISNCANLEKVNLYEGITNLNSNFENNTSLHYIDLPEGLISIGNRAFANSGLYSVNLPSTLKSIGNSAFYGNYISELILPEGLTSLGDSAFMYNDNLKEVVIPDSITEIPMQCFCMNSANALKKVTLPRYVEYIGSSAFPSNVEYVEIKDLLNWCNIDFESLAFPNAYLYINGVKLEDVVIPDAVTTLSLPLHFGKHCNSITVGAGVTSIESKYLYQCNHLYVSPDNTVFDSRNECNAIIETDSNTLIISCKNTTIPDTVVKIGKEAFEEGGNRLFIPDSVTTIGNSAFYKCTLSGGKGIQETEEYAFSYSNINGLDLSNLRIMGENTFYMADCDELELPIVEDIPTEAFYYSGIKNIILGENTKTLGDNILNGSEIKILTCLAATAPTISSNTFNGIVSYTGTLRYPKGSDYSTWIAALTNEDGTTSWTFEEIE